MRIIAGVARGTILECPDTARPTADRVKEGMFSAVEFIIPAARCLDLCAGSGALGAEALSRGAGLCVFVEQSRTACETIKQNLKKAGLFEKARVLAIGAEAFCETSTDKYDIIFFDPPYEDPIRQKLPAKLCRMLNEEGQIFIESNQKEIELPPELVLKKSYRYGKVFVFRAIKERKIGDCNLSR